MNNLNRAVLQSRRLSRRLLLGGGAAAIVAAGLPHVRLVRATLPRDDGADPRPIPGGVRNAHFYVPGPNALVSTIDDFSGVVGVADLLGTGTGVLADGTSLPLTFRVDNRFMMGQYIGADGELREGAFAEL